MLLTGGSAADVGGDGGVEELSAGGVKVVAHVRDGRPLGGDRGIVPANDKSPFGGGVDSRVGSVLVASWILP